MLFSRSLLAFGLCAAATAQIIDLNDPAQRITEIVAPAGRQNPDFDQVRSLPQRLQDQNLSSNEVFEVENAQLGALQTHEFAGLLTGVAGPGSNVNLYNVDEELFRPFCFNDTDCDSGSCNVSLVQLAPNDPDRQTILVQGLDNTFYCNAPGEGNSQQETCATQIARGAEQPQTTQAAINQLAALADGEPLPYDFQRPDGYCTNNLTGQEMWGGNQRLEQRRYNGIPLDIEDERSGAPDAVSPRTVSDEVCDEPGDFPNQFGTSTLLAYCGQFIDHDLTLIEFQPPETRITITGSPPTDAQIVFELSVIVPGTFPVMNPNTGTAFMDLSMVYGNTLLVAFSLRKPDYLAALDFSLTEINGDPENAGLQMFLPLASQIQGNLSMPPPPDPNNFTRFVPTAMHPMVANLFSAGDLRANEQVMLISWHTLFLREHNRLVQVISGTLNADDPNAVVCEPASIDQINALTAPAGCELLYQLARRVNIAQWQRVAFEEYFGTWHSDNPAQPNGPNSLSLSYQAGGGYDPEVNSDIDIFFSTAAYRFGHTIVRTYVVEKGPQEDDPFRSVFLGNAFFNTQEVTRADRFGTSGFLLGASKQCGSSLDQFISTGIRNFLFGNIPGSDFRNSDLLAFNVERCRDHGCPLYNDINAFFNYSQVETYEQLVSRNAEEGFEIPQCYVDTLRRVFGTDEIDGTDLVDNVDPMIACLIEPATFGQFGVCLFSVIRDQFLRSMVGDRYFYLNDEGPAPAQITSAGFSIQQIEQTTIAQILNSNSFFGREIVIDPLTGATQTPEGALNAFSNTPFVAPTTGEGECCVNDGESELTPVCFRNASNPFQFDVVELSRCDALAALEAQGASFGAAGGFVAGTMLPITFTPYNCRCNRYADEAITIEATLITQSRSNDQIISQLQSDFMVLTGEPDTGIGSISAARMPSSNIQITPNAADPTQMRVVIQMNESPDPDLFQACDVMFGLVDSTYATSTQTQLLTAANVVNFDCVNCPPLPSDFVIDAQGAGAAEEAQLFGLPVAVGGAIIGGVALVLLIVVGCGVRMYMNKRAQMNMFTSGQESV